MNPEELLTLSKLELVEKLEKLNLKNEDIMSEMVMIRSELLTRLEESKMDGELIGEFAVNKNTRISFKTTLEQAKELGAVKEAPDTTMLKKLHSKGVEVPGTQVTTYLSVRRVERKETK